MNEHLASKRAEGKIEEIGGAIKKTIGHLLGDEEMEDEGRAERLKGQLQQDAAKAHQRTRGAVEELNGTVKKVVGEALADEQLEIEGKLEELRGRARQKLNQ